MQILGLILLILAYTIGVITIFLEIICYQRKIEYIETIFFTIAFLLVIFSISISCLLDFFNPIESYDLSTFMNITLVGLVLTTPLNVFAERQINISPWIKNALYITSAILIILLIANHIFQFVEPNYIYTLVSVFLGISIVSSMLLVRNSEPGIHIKHREKIERIMAMVVMTLLPLFLILEFFYFKDTNIPLTLSVFFIILATSKCMDDFTRLSLLKPENSVKPLKSKNFNLTQREQEVADLLVKGYTYAKIGETLYISMPTVKTHVSNIYKKVEVKNKMELFYALSE